jgi:hypothetical protein
MKVSELIAVLQRRLEKHGDLEVLTTWEGTVQEIEPNSVYKERDALVLFIDADGNSSVNPWAEDSTEGEDGL